MTLQDIEHIEEAKILVIIPFAVLPSFMCESMLKSNIWTPFECLKILTQAVYIWTAYYLTSKVPNIIK